MAEKNNQYSILSSWKEIAVYLNSGVRTCMRWEKEDNLPVHRIEGKLKSSVFAYEHELDAWLEKKLSSNAYVKKDKSPSSLLKKSFFILLPIVAVVVIYLLFSKFFILEKKPAPKKPMTTSGVPQSTGPLTMEDNDIVTTEFAGRGRLRVWRKEKGNSYQEVWRMEPVSHASLAIGNVDDKKDCEIVAPGVCREVLERGDRKEYTHRFFLNIYKQGKKDWWKTTFYSKADCVYEEKVTDVVEIAVGNVDGEPGNEIVLMTMHNISVFKYDPELEEFKLLRSRLSFLEDVTLLLKSVVVGNIDEDDSDEILIAADEFKNGGTPYNRGWILILKFQDNWPKIFKSVKVDANLAVQSLRLGDVIKGGRKEIISPAYRNVSDTWNSYILGWDTNGDKIIDKSIYDSGYFNERFIHMDVGNLIPDGGDEIIVGHHAPGEIIYYYWDGTKLVEGSRFPLSANAALTNVFISDVDSEGDSPGEIIGCGVCRVPEMPGQFYIEMLGFDNDFFSKWKRLGGEREEIRVSYAAFGKKRE